MHVCICVPPPPPPRNPKKDKLVDGPLLWMTYLHFGVILVGGWGAAELSQFEFLPLIRIIC